jgi:predicted dehydrogenase
MRTSVLHTAQPAAATTAPSTATDRVSVCVVGAGSGVAPRHIEAFGEHPATAVDALIESDPARAELLRARHPGIAVTDRLPAAPRGAPGLAVVCVPDAAHTDVVTRCLDAGWHVLCEKPLTDDPEAAERLFALAEDAGLHLAVAYQRRFMLEDLHQRVADGAIGRLHCVNARWLRRAGHPESRRGLDRRGSGVRGDLIPHLLSQGLPFLGPGPLSVQARDWRVGDGWATEDVARLIARGHDGIELQVDVAYDAPHLDRPDDCWVELHGGLGSIHAELPTHQDAEWAAAHPPVLYPRTGTPERLAPLRTTAECHLLQADRIVRSLAAGPAPAADRDRELALVRTMAAAQASALHQGPIIQV